MEPQLCIVNLISHSSDAKSRRELITSISTGRLRTTDSCRITAHAPDDLLSRRVPSETVLEYEWYGGKHHRAKVEIADSTYAPGLFTMDELCPEDIIYIDISDGYSEAKLEWVKQFKNTDATIWYFTGSLRPLLDGRYIRVGYDCKKDWYQYIEETYGIVRPMQTIISLLGDRPNQPQDTPWPPPRMTISVPKGVIIESAKVNPANNTIEVIFG